MASSDFSNTPAIKLTSFFMKFAGFWISNGRRGKIIMDLAMAYTIIAIIGACGLTGSDLWFSRSNFYQAAYAASNAITVLLILLKLTMFSLRRGAFMNLIRYCYENFWERNYDSFGRSILRGCETRCVYFVGTFTFFAQCTVCSYMLHPIIESLGKNESDRILPFTIWLDIPVTTTPYYEITFFFETLALVHSGICYFCFDNFLCIMNVHAAGQFRILQRKFELMCERADSFLEVSFRGNRNGFTTGKLAEPHDQYSEFKDYIREHQSLIRFTKMIEETYTFVILGQVIIFSVLICLVSYQAALADGSLPRRMIFIVHSAGTFTQLFMFTLTCDDLIRESQEVAEAAYRARWYCGLKNPGSGKLGKDLIIVIMRARRPCCLTAGGFFPISLETFTTILTTSLSYLTLLRQGQEDTLP